MTTEYFLIDDGRDRQTVKAISERFPQFDVVPSLALVVEPVYPVYAGAFVIPAQQEEVLRVFDLVSEQQAYRFQRLLASVDIVAEEQIVRLRRETPVLEQP